MTVHFNSSVGERSGFIKTISDTLRMSFLLHLVLSDFTESWEQRKLAHHISLFTSFTAYRKRVKQASNKIKQLVIVLDNSSIHKTKEAMKFILDSNIPMITIPLNEPYLNPVVNLILAIKTKIREMKQQG